MVSFDTCMKSDDAGGKSAVISYEVGSDFGMGSGDTYGVVISLGVGSNIGAEIGGVGDDSEVVK